MHSRRRFLRTTSLAMAAGLPLFGLSRRARAQGYGPLVPDPDGIFDLPEGFSYRVMQRRGDPMSDGFLAPGKMDGMTCFLGEEDTYVILRNHELNASHPDAERPFPITDPAPPNTYDPNEPGGVVRLVLDRKTLEILDSRLVLYGTTMNCAGGKSPWGWLTCEEIGDAYELDPALTHGYVFLVKPDDNGDNEPRPIPNYGRFRHEAAVVEPSSLTCYLTEDRNDSCVYRFVPKSEDEPFEGELQALKVVGQDRMNVGSGLNQGVRLDVEWVSIDDPIAVTATTRAQGQALGAAIFVRGEGIAEHRGDIYICATTGGPQGLGQIFRYRPDDDARPFDPTSKGTLELVLQNEDEATLAQPDNLIVAPWGDVYLCEDAFNGSQHLRVLDPEGRIFDFGYNALSSLELAGVCFSPDGKALFVNLQHDGLMLAITGPFPKLPEDDVKKEPVFVVGLEGSACSVNRSSASRNALLGAGAAAATALLRRRS